MRFYKLLTGVALMGSGSASHAPSSSPTCQTTTESLLKSMQKSLDHRSKFNARLSELRDTFEKATREYMGILSAAPKLYSLKEKADCFYDLQRVWKRHVRAARQLRKLHIEYEKPLNDSLMELGDKDK